MRYRVITITLFVATALLAGLSVRAAEAICTGDLTPSNPANPVVKLHTELGSVCVEVLSDQAPNTAANFLAYVNNGDVEGTFFHRTVAGFIAQGGGFRLNVQGDLIEDIPDMGTVDNEACVLDSTVVVETSPGVSQSFQVCSERGNERGTMAMAKLGGDPDSATNEWFFNVADNRANLDNQNGGFTVFARVLGDGMAVVDLILALPHLPNAAYSLNMAPLTRLSAFATLPVLELPSEPAGGFGCFDVDQLAVLFDDTGEAGFDNVGDTGDPESDATEPSGFRVVSAACGSAIAPALLGDPPKLDFDALPSQTPAQCTTPDRFAWGVLESSSPPSLAFSFDQSGFLEAYSLTCAEVLESDAELADRRSVMMTRTGEQMVFVEAAQLLPEIVNPQPGATLSGSTQTFTWTANDAQADGWSITLGSTPGGSDYASATLLDGDASELTLDGLPTEGETIHATLRWREGGQFDPSNTRHYVFTAADLPYPDITSPAPDGKLTSSKITFGWRSNGHFVQQFQLYVGSSPGASDFFVGPVLGGGAQTQAVSGLPTDGSPVHVRLWSQIRGVWRATDVMYEASDPLPPPVLDGDACPTLSGPSHTLQWDAGENTVDTWFLYLGTELGASDVFNSGALDGATSNVSVDTLPTDGTPVYVRMWYLAARGSYAFVDYGPCATATLEAPKLQSPMPSTTLSLTELSLGWTDNGNNVSAWFIYVGTTAGGTDLANSGALDGDQSTFEVSGLPFDGSTVHVRLWFNIRGVWQSADYTYTAAMIEPPSMTAPNPVAVLNGAQVTFQWDANDLPVEQYFVYLGTSPGAADIDNSGPLDGDATQFASTELPLDGSTVHARLWYRIGGIWDASDVSYTSLDLRPFFDMPSPGSNLSDTEVTFEWDPRGNSVEQWYLYVGAVPGGTQYYNSGSLPGATTTQIVSSLPVDGSTVYVRLWYLIDGRWALRDEIYTAVDNRPQFVGPASLSSTIAMLEWQTSGNAVSEWYLYVGSSVGGTQYHNSGPLQSGDLDETVVNLPTDGSTVHVRLWYLINGQWGFVDTNYAAVDSRPTIGTPTSGAILGDNTTLVFDSMGNSVQNWWVYVGSSAGGRQYADSGELDVATPSFAVDGLSAGGSAIYVRLWYRIGGVWEFRDLTYVGGS